MKIYFGKRPEYFVEGKYWEEIRKDIVPTVEVDTIAEADKWLKDRIAKDKFDSYYIRMSYSTDNGWVECDFGSHNTFALYYDLSGDNWKQLFGDIDRC